MESPMTYTVNGITVIIDTSLLFLQEIQLVPACVIVTWNWEQSLLIPEIDCNWLAGGLEATVHISKLYPANTEDKVISVLTSNKHINYGVAAVILHIYFNENLTLS